MLEVGRRDRGPARIVDAAPPPRVRGRAARAGLWYPGPVILLPLLLTACGPDVFRPTDSASGELGVDIVSLAVYPPVATVHSTASGGEAVAFSVTATFDDGSSLEIADAEWEVSNSSAGSVTTDGTFVAKAGAGGITWVTAKFGGAEATATVTVIYEETLNESGVDVAPFAAAASEVDGVWTYPQDGVNFPRNTPSITFQWADLGHSAARLRFTSAVTDVTVYTTGTSWTADEALWQQIAATNAGGAVQVELALLVGDAVQAEAPISLNVNRMDGVGAVYYWSTSASGIKKIAYGEDATDYLTAAQTGRCVGCHAVAGDRVSFTWDGGDGAVGLNDLDSGSTVISADSGWRANFTTLSPDGAYLLAAYYGALLLFDARTGAYLYEVPTGGLATQPYWSPDGTQVAFVWYPSGAHDIWFTDGIVAVMDHNGDGTFSNPRTLFDAPAGYNAYYPAFSPDSNWVAFNVSTGDAYDDTDAAVWVIDRDGGTAVELVSANQAAGLTNSWPRWGPLPDDDILWIAFASKRVYGNVTTGNPQIWVAAFDPARAEAGADPSWPAFWLPGQDAAQSNHIPVWAE